MRERIVSVGFVRADEIIDEVGKEFGVPLHMIMDDVRTGTVTHARQEAMCRIREQTTLSTVEVGRIFKRHHTTVVHAWNRRRK